VETDGQRRRAGRGYLDEIGQEKEGSQEIANAHSAAARVGPGQMGWMTMMEERTAHARQGMDWQGQAGKTRPGQARQATDAPTDETRRDETARARHDGLRGHRTGAALFWGWGWREGLGEIAIVSTHTPARHKQDRPGVGGRDVTLLGSGKRRRVKARKTSRRWHGRGWREMATGGAVVARQKRDRYSARSVKNNRWQG
jgi:hypothetical protein